MAKFRGGMKWRRPRRIPWSRLKHLAEAHLADSLQRRVQFHTTRFNRKGEVGRFWIELDHYQIFSAADTLSLKSDQQ